ncbi:MAG: rod shape-determining protein MreD [Gammaproteobacteria bacterium CG11_big_fil_rev_8_21_14_0_20_46_22]|nr:MAG: rod shape-determining protein MreD [Gammaproteobacteria bacterium CG12_big_fil_rev_8_21_14_0_65_46_12]PIR11777.1 MAG: rod shape-determining protein MreD [Gammaproteobacteria bacterium CG11_big_fil_rev_8_21_14_0_20_46_22]
MQRKPRLGFVWLTLFVAFMLSLVPLPAWVNWLRPDFVLLVLLFWSISLPYSVSVGYAFIAGLLLDLCYGTALGEHALAMIIPVYFACKFHKQFNMFPGLQQLFVILAFSLLYKIIVFTAQGILASAPASVLYWLAALVNIVLWPWLFRLLSDLKRRVDLE